MRKPYRSPAEELICTGLELGISVKKLCDTQANSIFAKFVSKFNPVNTTNHCQIGQSNSQFEIRSEGNEYIFSEKLTKRNLKCIILFSGSVGVEAVELEMLLYLSNLLQNSFGMEFFVTDEKFTFGISVNFYAIEAVGDIDFDN